THHVHTGVSVRTPQGSVAWVESAEVAFGVLGRAEIEVYVLTGEPLDKAGAYAIQGGAGAFVTALAGDVDTVIGLPLRRLGGELAPGMNERRA
ncbi:Maf-like protein, partial [Citrobacter sp. AAK_AS5]